MRLFFIIICLICSIETLQAQSPNFNEWFRQKRTQRRYLVRQIAALKIYLEYLKKGYDIAQKGLTLIGDIKDGTFNLDKDYFNSLKAVSPVVRNSPKVNEILVYRQATADTFREFVSHCKKNDQLTDDEVRYIEAVETRITSECNVIMSELSIVCTAGQTEMQDEERLSRLDKAHHDMQDLYVFARDFIDTTNLLCMERKKQQREVDDARSIGGTI